MTRPEGARHNHDFKERIAYDPNGNILQYLRNGNHTFAGKPLASIGQGNV